MKKKAKAFLPFIICFSAVMITAAVILALFYFGVLHINDNSAGKYEVKGVDVSHYQGEIDWDVLSKQGISFAYIKATEGSSHVDPMFDKNYTAALNFGLRAGAYHFFSFESSGEKQAELYCNTVKSAPGMLPPVIDVEFYGRFKTVSDIDEKNVKKELRTLIEALTENYGMKPVIYADGDTYKTFLKGDFDDCDLWFRSVYSSPPADINWIFWQYSNRHVLKGYSGDERYIDMNVFRGGFADFAAYPN